MWVEVIVCNISVYFWDTVYTIRVGFSMQVAKTPIYMYPVMCRFQLCCCTIYVITIHWRYRQTDRQTDVRTDGRHASSISMRCKRYNLWENEASWCVAILANEENADDKQGGVDDDDKCNANCYHHRYTCMYSSDRHTALTQTIN